MKMNITKTKTTCIICRSFSKSLRSIRYDVDVCSACFYYFLQPKRDQTFICPLPKGGGRFSDEISLKIGSEAEQKFFTLCQSKGYLIRPSSSHENRISHFDFVVGFSTHQFMRVEVKSIKARRRGEIPDPSIVFLEIQNIDGGKGWIYGHSDYIAFEHPKGFVLYRNQDIVSYVELFSKSFPFVTQSGIEFTLYGRRQRKDVVMVVPFAHLNYHLSHKLFI